VISINANILPINAVLSCGQEKAAQIIAACFSLIPDNIKKTLGKFKSKFFTGYQILYRLAWMVYLIGEDCFKL